jgi:hypothetical protein
MRRSRETNRIGTGIVLCVAFFVVLGVSFPPGEVAFAQELIVYPTKGQSAQQQEKDEFDCYKWAKSKSGFDPMEVPKATAPPPAQEAQVGGVGRGAVRGDDRRHAEAGPEGARGAEAGAVGPGPGGELPAEPHELQPRLLCVSRGSRLYGQVIDYSLAVDRSGWESACSPPGISISTNPCGYC